MQKSDVQDLQIKTADGTLLNLRFDLGIAKFIKQITGVDPMKQDLADDLFETGAAIFAAAYMRACKIYKTPPAHTVDDLKEYFEELSVEGALNVIRAFNGVMYVAINPEAAEKVKDAEAKDGEAPNP